MDGTRLDSSSGQENNEGPMRLIYGVLGARFFEHRLMANGGNVPRPKPKVR
jgi:hypothetical protein